MDHGGPSYKKYGWREEKYLREIGIEPHIETSDELSRWNMEYIEQQINYRKLCEFLTDNDVIKYSLEMQIWWRDNKEEYKDKEESGLLEAKKKGDKKKLLSKIKLTDYEKELLGVEDK